MTSRSLKHDHSTRFLLRFVYFKPAVTTVDDNLLFTQGIMYSRALFYDAAFCAKGFVCTYMPFFEKKELVSLSNHVSNSAYTEGVLKMLVLLKKDKALLPTYTVGEGEGLERQLISAPDTAESKLLHDLQHGLFESLYAQARNLNSPRAIFVLARAPAYRLSLATNVPISSSQHYRNIYKQATKNNLRGKSLIQKSLFAKSYVDTLRLRFARNYRKKLEHASLKSVFGTRLSRAWKQLSAEYRSLCVSKTLARAASNNFTAGIRLGSRKRIHRRLSKRRRSDKTRIILNLKVKSAHLRFRKRPRNKQVLPTKQDTLLQQFNLYRVSRVILRVNKRKLKRSRRRIKRRVKWKSRRLLYLSRRAKRISRSRRTLLRLWRSSGHSNIHMSRTGGYFRKRPQVPSGLSQSTSLSRIDSKIFLQRVAGRALGVTVEDYVLTNTSILLHCLTSPFLLKSLLYRTNNQLNWRTFRRVMVKNLSEAGHSALLRTNLIPHDSFDKTLSKNVLNSLANQRFREDIIPFYQNTLIRFIEFCTGRRAIFQFYPFVNQHVGKEYMVRYHRWLPRLTFYERRLGHRFFLEEALHILHLGFALRDPKIIASWLKAIILRISFWKTRSIFRFLKYLFNNYFIHVFDDIKIKGMKIRLKGKISAAGNSRKRTILYRIGQTSHAKVNLRVLKDFSLINTFTGVMGFQVYLFY